MRRYVPMLLVTLLIAVICPAEAGKKPLLHESTGALTTQEIARRALPCVARLTVRDTNGQTVVSGSGFVAGQNLIITNAHVIRNAGSVTANFLNGRSEKVLGVVALDQNHDLALLYVVTSGITPLPFADTSKAQIGDPVMAVGSPEGLDGSISTGVVSSIRLSGSSRLIQTNAAISHGSSGGPLLNDRGQVLGVTSFMFTDGQNLNFAYSSYYVRQLIPTFVTRFQPFGSTEWAYTIGKYGIVGRAGIVLQNNIPIWSSQDHNRLRLTTVSKGVTLCICGEINQDFAVIMGDKTPGFIAKKDIRLLSTGLFPPVSSQALGQSIVKEANKCMAATMQAASLPNNSAYLVKSVFASVGVIMPDNVEDQATVGYDVPHNVAAGDWTQWVLGDRLYFACHHPRIDETGIYIGNGLFIHVTDDAQIKDERIDDAFFSSHLVAVRRSQELLNEPPAAQPALKTQTTTDSTLFHLSGSAVAYYLYSRSLANHIKPLGRVLYKSKNGMIYYRDGDNHHPVWITVPVEGVNVKMSDLQQFAPDYEQYQGKAYPDAPLGDASQSATEFDSALFGDISGSH